MLPCSWWVTNLMDIHCPVFLPILMPMLETQHLSHGFLRTPILRPRHLEWLSRLHWPLRQFCAWHLLLLLRWMRFRGTEKIGMLGIVWSDRGHRHKPVFVSRCKDHTGVALVWGDVRRKVGFHCRGPPEWEVQWLPRLGDLDLLEVSGACHLRWLGD